MIIPSAIYKRDNFVIIEYVKDIVFWEININEYYITLHNYFNTRFDQIKLIYGYSNIIALLNTHIPEAMVQSILDEYGTIFKEKE